MKKEYINPFGGQEGFKKRSPKLQLMAAAPKQKGLHKLDGFEWIYDEAGGICGEDVEYVEQEEMLGLPHRHIGVVLAVHPMGVFQLGTGLLISRDLVLTCAHVTHSKEYMAEFESIYFYPAQYGELSNYIKIEGTATPEEYLTEEKWLFRKAYDYTLLKLTEKVDESGFLPLSGDQPQLDKNTILTINGYPESKYDKKNKIPKAVKQYGLTRKGYILDVYSEASYMVHRISAEAGQSGAPIVKIEENGKMSVIGLHVGSPQEKSSKYQKEFPELQKVNIAKLMNRHMVERLKVFVIRLGGEMFNVLPVDQALYQNTQQEKKQWDQEKQELLLKIKKMEEEKQQEFSNYQEQNTKLVDVPKASNTKQDWLYDGKQHCFAGRYQQAVKCYQRALIIDRNIKQAYISMGYALYYLGRKGDALSCIQQAKYIDSNDTNTNTRMGNILWYIGRHREALVNYQKVLAIDPNHKYAHNGVGNVLNSLGQDLEALASYRKALKIDPNYAYAYNGMGNVLRVLGRNTEALASYRKALAIDPNLYYAHVGIGDVFYNLGGNEEALASYKKSLAIYPNNKQALNRMGLILQKLGKYDESVATYHRAIQLDYTYWPSYQSLKLLLLKQCRTKVMLAESVGFLEGVILQHPNSWQAVLTV